MSLGSHAEYASSCDAPSENVWGEAAPTSMRSRGSPMAAVSAFWSSLTVVSTVPVKFGATPQRISYHTNSGRTHTG